MWESLISFLPVCRVPRLDQLHTAPTPHMTVPLSARPGGFRFPGRLLAAGGPQASCPVTRDLTSVLSGISLATPLPSPDLAPPASAFTLLPPRREQYPFYLELTPLPFGDRSA